MRNFAAMEYQVECFPAIHVKLSPYVGDFLRKRYGVDCRGRVCLPQTHPCGKIIYQNLVSNPGIKRLTPRCYNSMMYGIVGYPVPQEVQDCLPHDRQFFVSFRIFKPHYWMGRYIPDDETMQLDATSTQSFVGILHEEFWQTLMSWLADYQDMVLRQGRKPEIFYGMLDFCETYEVSMDYVDALYRQYMRRKQPSHTLEV